MYIYTYLWSSSTGTKMHLIIQVKRNSIVLLRTTATTLVARSCLYIDAGQRLNCRAILHVDRSIDDHFQRRCISIFESRIRLVSIWATCDLL